MLHHEYPGLSQEFPVYDGIVIGISYYLTQRTEIYRPTHSEEK